jgi:acyl carrier protein
MTESKDPQKESQSYSPEMIRQTLVELLEADTGEKYPNLDEKTNLREGLGLDSVDVVSIVSQIERRFHIRLTHEELQTLATVGDVLNLLQSKLTAPAAGSQAA